MKGVAVIFWRNKNIGPTYFSLRIVETVEKDFSAPDGASSFLAPDGATAFPVPDTEGKVLYVFPNNFGCRESSYLL